MYPPIYTVLLYKGQVFFVFAVRCYLLMPTPGVLSGKGHQFVDTHQFDVWYYGNCKLLFILSHVSHIDQHKSLMCYHRKHTCQVSHTVAWCWYSMWRIRMCWLSIGANTTLKTCVKTVVWWLQMFCAPKQTPGCLQPSWSFVWWG